MLLADVTARAAPKLFIETEIMTTFVGDAGCEGFRRLHKFIMLSREESLVNQGAYVR